MIKFAIGQEYTKSQNTLVGLGITEENIRRMREGDPMHFSLSELGVEGVEIVILVGENENTIAKTLMENFNVQDFRDHKSD